MSQPGIRQLPALLAVIAAVIALIWFWPRPQENRPADFLAARPAGTGAVAENRSNTDVPTPQSATANVPAPPPGLATLEERLNDRGFVTVDRRFLQPMSAYPPFNPSNGQLIPTAVIMLELDQGEADALHRVFTGYQQELEARIAEDAVVTELPDGIALHLSTSPEAIDALVGSLRRDLEACLDPVSRLNLDRFSDRSLQTGLLPVPLEEVTITITRDDERRYRMELLGESERQRTRLWQRGNAASVLREFYGERARAQLPHLEEDMRLLNEQPNDQ